jgi:predicted N-acetyltransferase YhbS
MSKPVIRPMHERDLDAADRVHRIAFGTRFGLPDPGAFRGDAQMVRTRWATDPEATCVVEIDGSIVGGACAMDWGSVFVLGPVFVLPDQAGRGLAHLVVEAMMAIADRRGAKLAGLFTFPESATHLRLYESAGFVAQTLTPIMTKQPGAAGQSPGLLFSKLGPAEQDAAVLKLARLTDLNFPGLDLTREIRAVARLGMGDTILIGEAHDPRALAICHYGPRGEGGTGTLFIKFAATRPGADADFAQLVDCCEGLATATHAQHMIAGTNTARTGAYRILRERGFRAGLVGVAMHRPDGPDYNRPDLFVIDDWR